MGVLAVAATAVGKALLDVTLTSAKFADNLSALHTQTGLSFKALQEFGLAAKLGNSSVEAIAGGVNKMQIALSKGSAAFGMLGINVAEFKKLAPEDQLRVVAEQILNPMGIRALFFVVSAFVALEDRNEARAHVVLMTQEELKRKILS